MASHGGAASLSVPVVESEVGMLRGTGIGRHRLGALTGLVSLWLVAAVAAAAPTATAPANAQLWTDKQPAETGLSPDTPVTMGAFAKLSKVVSPTVINITTVRVAYNTWGGRGENQAAAPSNASGTGFFIHRDGYALTNHHVIAGARQITVRTVGDRTYQARVVGSDPYTDLALIKVAAPTPFPVAPLGDSDKLEIGEWVVAIGNPYGLGHTVTAGIVSAKGRSTIMPGKTRYSNYIQTDASINPGNSGGPLVNIRGQVVGINSAVHGKAQGIGFAIPANMAKKLIPQLVRGRIERSWLGISVREVTPQVARTLGLKRAAGAYIERLVSGSPAAKAGLLPGDVIVRFNGHDVRRSTDLPWLAASAGVGTAAKVELIREGAPKAVQVKLTALPRKLGGHGRAPVQPTTEVFVGGLGMKVTTLTPALRRRFRLSASAGVLVIKVDRGGPADLVGLSPRDVIVGGYRTPLTSSSGLRQFADSFAVNEMVPLRVMRGRRRLFLMPKKSR